MTDQQAPNQVNRQQYPRISDALIASGQFIPLSQIKWEDFPLETRLRVLRVILADLFDSEAIEQSPKQIRSSQREAENKAMRQGRPISPEKPAAKPAKKRGAK